MGLSDLEIGHPLVVQQLNGVLQSRIFPNAFLFYGCSGSGKSFFARHFMEDLLCIAPVSYQACKQCKSCLLSRSDTHPDRMIILPDDKHSIKIETIREMQDFCSLKPVYASYKWILIEDAHYLTIEASQALLKNLEEPNSSSRFILTTHHLEGLIPTVRSRCSLIPFYAYSDMEMNRLLSTRTNDDVLIQELTIIARGDAKLAFSLLDPEYRDSYESLISLFFEISDHLFEKMPNKNKDEIITSLRVWEDVLLDIIKYSLQKDSKLYKRGAWLIKKFQPSQTICLEKIFQLHQQLIKYETQLHQANPYLPAFNQCLLSDIYHAFHS